MSPCLLRGESFPICPQIPPEEDKSAEDPKKGFLMQMIYLSRKDVEDLNVTMKEVLVAVDDMVTAKVLYERAIKTGAGVRLPL